MTRRLLAFAACVLVAGCSRPVADVAAADLHAKYRDRPAADAEFAGRTFAVGGIVRSVGHSWLTPFDWVSVHLGWDGDGPGEGVVCHFPPGTAGEAAELLPGQPVVIRGVCRGELLGGVPYLSDCRVMR